MTEHPSVADVRATLELHYPTVEDSRRIVADAGLDASLIEFSHQARRNWFAILEAARRDLRYHELLRVVSREHPRNALFARALQAERPVSSSAAASVRDHLEDWSTAPEVLGFRGRTLDLTVLRRWIVRDHCHVMCLYGIGGIGKTALAVVLARGLARRFERTKWTSLLGGPRMPQVLDEAIVFFSSRPLSTVEPGADDRSEALLKCLQERPCLLILDNLDTVARDADPRNERWIRLFRLVGETEHESCVVVTTREKPSHFPELEARSRQIRSHRVLGLPAVDGQRLMDDLRLSGSRRSKRELWGFYSGNPLAIKLAAGPIRDLCQGSVSEFFQRGPRLFGGVRELLDHQLRGLDDDERAVMYWLAIDGGTLSVERLRERLRSSSASSDEVVSLSERLRALSLIELASDGSVFLQAVVAEFVVDRLVGEVVGEINGARLATLVSHALVIAMAEEHRRERQVAVIVQRVIAILTSSHGEGETRRLLGRLLSRVRERRPGGAGYAAGNAINLWLATTAELNGLDLRGLQIREGYFVHAALHDVNAEGTEFHNCVFADTFDNLLTIDVTRDGTLFAIGSSGGEVRVFRVREAQEAIAVAGHSDRVWVVRFSPDGLTLASSGDDGVVRLWNVATGRLIGGLEGHVGPVRALAFSPDGRTLATGGNDSRVRLWDREQRACLRVVEFGDWVWCLAFAPDGTRLACGGNDGEACELDLRGDERRRIGAHETSIRSIAYSPDGTRLASGGNDAVIRVWETLTGRLLQVLQGHDNGVRSVSFSPDGRVIASGSDDSTIRLWHVATGAAIRTLQGHSSQVTAVAFLPDGRMLASASDDHTVRVWQTRSGQVARVLRGYTNSTRSIGFSPDARLLVGGFQDGYVRVWPADGGKLVTAFRCDSPVRSISVAAGGRRVVTAGEERNVKIWDVDSGLCLVELVGHENWVRAVALSPTGRILATGSEDRTVRLWDVDTSTVRGVLRGHGNWIRCVVFSADGRWLASSSDDRTVRVWDVATGMVSRVVEEQAAPVRSVAFSPDQASLAVASDDGRLTVYATTTGERVCSWLAHTGWIGSIGYSPRGGLLASGGLDRTVRLWDAAQAREVASLGGHTSAIRSVAFSPTADVIVSGGDDATIRLWTLDGPKAVIHCDRPYERMNITGALGLSPVQRGTLQRLGAGDTRSLGTPQ